MSAPLCFARRCSSGDRLLTRHQEAHAQLFRLRRPRLLTGVLRHVAGYGRLVDVDRIVGLEAEARSAA